MQNIHVGTGRRAEDRTEWRPVAITIDLNVRSGGAGDPVCVCLHQLHRSKKHIVLLMVRIMPLITAPLKQTIVADSLVFNKRQTINNHHDDSNTSTVRFDSGRKSGIFVASFLSMNYGIISLRNRLSAFVRKSITWSNSL